MKIACQMTKMVSFSECGLQRLCHPPNPPLLTPIGHFSMSMPITCCYYIHIFLVPFSTAHFGWHQIRAHILWPKYGWIKEQILERIKLVELDEIENNICWNFTLRFAMSNNLFLAKVFIFFGKGRIKGKWRWVKLDHKWYCIKSLWKLTGLWTCQEVCLFWEKLLPEL